MGRRKIQIKPIEDERSRNVTFNKRKQGLVKKAMELSILCSCDINLVVFADDKLYEYTTDDPRTILEKYCERASEPHERYSNEDYWKKFDKSGSKDNGSEDKSPAKSKKSKSKNSSSSKKKPKKKSSKAKKDASQEKTDNTSDSNSSSNATTTTTTTDTIPVGSISGSTPSLLPISQQEPAADHEAISPLGSTTTPLLNGFDAGKANNGSSAAHQDRLLPPSSRHKRKRSASGLNDTKNNKKRKQDLTVSIPMHPEEEGLLAAASGGVGESAHSSTLPNLATPQESATPTLFSDPNASPVTTPLSAITATSSKLDTVEWPDMKASPRNKK